MLHILLLLALSSSSFGEDIIILSNVAEFTNFVNDVNSGNDYPGTTIYLGSDLSLSGETFYPIGNTTSNYFRGVFDGQGHVISNLQMSASLQYTGLFGCSTELTIRNVVLDDSCSIKSTYSVSGSAFTGGIIGRCEATSGDCVIENNVNMAGLTFNGSTSSNMFIGGIVGSFYSTSSSCSAYVKNCVNYGSVTHSGIVRLNYAELGGIVGYSNGNSSDKYNYIQNCLNYGTITHSGTSANLIIGGIVGNDILYTYIENCVSAGKIDTPTTATTYNHIGSIVGYIKTDIHIDYCYYTSDVGLSSIRGYGTPSSTTETPESPTDVNLDLVSKLNNNATSCNWNKWLLNANKATVTFKMGDDKELSFSSQIILTQNPVKEGNSFLFWCNDAECNDVFDPATESVSGTTDLYAAWVNNTVTFDFGNGTTVNETFSYNTEIIYPNNLPEEEGYTLYWSDYHEIMPARNITVTAQWTPNNYTAIFDFGNGTTVNETFTYNTEIVYPDYVPEKEGYTFSQWGNYHEFMPARNITVTAQWTPNNYTVTFDFDNGTTVNETFSYNTEIAYPNNLPEKEGYTLSWGNYHEFMPAKNITVTAQWTPNNYTVAFDANGGSVSGTSKIVTFNEKYGDLPEPEKSGYMFFGWFTNETDGTEVTNETIVNAPDNHTLYAHWEEVTNQVEIVFNTKDLTKGDVEKFIEKYTDAKYEITEFGSESGDIRVIITFKDTEKAKEFTRSIKESDEAEGMIKKFGFGQGNDDDSVSTMAYPLSFFISLFL